MNFCLRKWDDICALVDKGGFGIRSLSQLDEVFLTILAWRIVSKSNFLLARIFDAKYNKGRGWWFPTISNDNNGRDKSDGWMDINWA